MSAVVADAGPLRYLVLIEIVDILLHLFGRVLIPEIVGAELGRLLDPNDGNVTLAPLQPAAEMLGRKVRLDLV